jgi:histidyl-tRNA synthetase
VIESAPWEDFFPLSDRFKELGVKLEAQGISYHVNRRLVRGLDYYNGVVFEITAEGLGAQNAVAGGGRYNNLYQELGGSTTPCTGFSIGMERLLTAIEAQDPKAFEALRSRKVYFAPLEDHAEILQLCRQKALALREAGIRPETSPGVFSLSQHLKKANQLGLRFMVIVGPDELRKKVVVVKDLEKREQEEVDIEQSVAHLKKVMNLC